MSNLPSTPSTSPFEITTFGEAERFAKMIADSDFAPKDYKGKPGNVLIAMQMGHELGIKPMQAIQNIAVINGRPSLFGDLALALIIGNPECKGVREWMTGTIKGGDAVCSCEVKRNKEVITREFSIKQAIQANLMGKVGPWTQYPERMLALRARGFALRDSFPDVLKGVYIEGELVGVDFADGTKLEEAVEKPKLGTDAVKQSIAKAVNSMAAEVEKESKALNMNPETGEIDEPEIDPNAPTFADVKAQFESAQTVDDLVTASDVARELNFPTEQRDQLAELYKAKQKTVRAK